MYYLYGSKTVVSQASATRKGSMMEVWDRQHEGTLAWMPTEGKPANKYPTRIIIARIDGVLVSSFTPRSTGWPRPTYPKASRRRLRPSQGITVSVVSKPAATSKGL